MQKPLPIWMLRSLAVVFLFCNLVAPAQGNFAGTSRPTETDRTKERSQSDTNAPATALSSVLKKLNQEKGIFFMFTDPSIGSTQVSVPDYRKQTETILDEITRQVGLEYKKVADNTYVIRSANRSRSAGEEKLYKFDQVAVEDIIVKGKVFNAKDNTPLENVTVKVVGAKKGTTTKADGSFTITVQKGQSLEFSSVNMVARTIKVNDTKEVQIFLQESENNLSEVMVVAYSNQKRSTFTGAATTVKTSVLESAPTTSVQESIQGNVAGVQSTNGSGQPGQTPDIRVRGIGSISASSTPLYVIDGIPVVSGDISGGNTNTIAGLNPNDIASMTILKDASANSLYGSRAANGVVLITTKSGKAGKVKVNFTYQRGYNNYTIRDEQKTLTTSQYIQYYREGWVNAGNPVSSYDSLLTANRIDTSINTDWFEQVLRQGKYSQYNLNVSGGSDRSTYYMSGSYYASEAPTKGVDYNRGTFRTSVTAEISKKWSVKGGMAGSYQRSTNFLGGSFFGNPIRAMYRLAPWLPVYESDGVTYELGYNNGYNPVAVIETTKRLAQTYNLAANASTTFKIMEGLQYEGSLALDFNHAFRSIYYDPRVGNTYVAVGGSVTNYTQDITNWVATNILRYKRSFRDKHIMEVFAGYEAQSRGDLETNVTVNGIAPGTSTPAGGSLIESATGTATGYKLVSKFLNGSYAFRDRYFVSGSIREDACSRFAKNFRSAIFWSAGIGWNIANENFFKIRSITELKLRASYGYTGNQGIDNFESQGLYSTGGDYNQSSGLTLAQLANDNLTWEKNRPFNIGLDFVAWKGRFTGSVEWYSRESSNLLRSQPVPSTNGVTTVTVNNGAMKNTGIEATVSMVLISPTKARGFKWTTDMNITSYRNEITKIDSNFSNNANYLRRVGTNYYTHYQRVFAGVDPQTGEALWYTSSDKEQTTNNFTQAVRIRCGSALPRFYGGMSHTLSYMNFRLSMHWFINWGNFIYDDYGYLQKTDANLGFSDQSNGISRYEYGRRWTTPGQITNVPKPVFLGTQSSSGSYESSRFLYDGSYIRLRDVQLSYSIPKKWLAKYKINTARAYVRGQNLYTWVKDKGYNTDPEAGIDGVLSQKPPVFNTVLFGIEFTL
ncbi:MAG: SusC/RagA family TonB-linked outer membrane protein [Bacteroidota bacterium]